MRELKFRAWDPEEKKMYDIQSIDFARQQFWVKHDLCSYSFGVVPILQYTGLKDINGKEIYEGDIVRIERGAEWPDSVEVVEWCDHIDTDRDWQYCAGFLIDMAYSVRSNALTASSGEIQLTNLEVIGNLYETPHLAPKSEEAQ